MFSLQALGSATGCSGGAKERNILEWWCVVPALACALAYIFTRPALYVVGVVILLVGPLSWCARGVVSTRHQRDIGVLAVASLGVWILPEFLAFDLKLDDRQTWMRFNTVLRFWPEGYYLIPFVVTLAFASPLCDTLHHHTRRRWRGFFPCAAGVLVLTFGVSHIAAIKNRAFRYAHPPSLNGADFIAREAAVDAQIIAYLSSQSNERKMVLGEGCGTGVYRPTPVNYSWPGRFSTFSGWPGMCGWSRHVQLHNPRLAEREWDGSRQSLHFMQAYESAYLAAVSFAGASLQGFQSGEKPGEWSSTHSPESLRHVFTTMGVTHLVFGESEGNAYGRVSLATLAQVVGGRVEFRVPGTEFGVVEIGKG